MAWARPSPQLMLPRAERLCQPPPPHLLILLPLALLSAVSPHYGVILPVQLVTCRAGWAARRWGGG
jgi:hypothetical protein